MTTLVNAMRTKDTVTENGMVTNSTSLSATVDLFFTIGAVRKSMKTVDGKARIIALYEAARNEDPIVTRRLMFWARDIRSGAGEREAFRVLLRHAAINHPNEVKPNIHLIAEFGRWDDVFSLFGTPLEREAIELIVNELTNCNSLLAKWLPRLGGKVSPSKKWIANKVRSAMNMGPKEYRKMLANLSNVVETPMCAKEFDKIEYSKVPSLAMSRYSKAFGRNDEDRFTKYIIDLQSGETKINAGAVYPYDILKNLNTGEHKLAVEQWKALPNYMEGSKERVLPICDVSGSMETPVSGITTAMDVCISLGLYISERNEGPFKDAFITFSGSPQLHYLTGDLRSRYSQLRNSDWGYNTNLEATFDLILNQATKHKVSKEEMPTCLLIFSDMEFDQAVDTESTAIEMIKTKFEKSGYDLPKIVFWNLCSRGSNIPVTTDEKGTSLVSGFSPSLLKTVLSGESMDPVKMMLSVLDNKRYQCIK